MRAGERPREVKGLKERRGKGKENKGDIRSGEESRGEIIIGKERKGKKGKKRNREDLRRGEIQRTQKSVFFKKQNV